jgi:hypothetical protein
MKQIPMKWAAAGASALLLALTAGAPGLAGEAQGQSGGGTPMGAELPMGADERALPGPSQAQSQEAQTPTAEGQGVGGLVAGRRAGDIAGTPVLDPSGETIGHISAILADRETRRLQALVSVGGFFGLGADRVMVPLSELALVDGGVAVPLARTADDLKARPRYEEGVYIGVPGDRMVPLGHSAGEAEGYVFEDLDSDSDGYLTREEVRGQGELAQEWARIDWNRDQRIGRAEFAAFESGGTPESIEETPSHRPQWQGEGGTAD